MCRSVLRINKRYAKYSQQIMPPRNNEAHHRIEEIAAIDEEEYARAWKGLESLEDWEARLRAEPQKFVNKWDSGMARLRLRSALIIGETIDFFVNDPEVIGGDDFLHGQLTAKQISQFIGYPVKHVYRFLRSEGEYVSSWEEHYRQGFRRGPFNKYRFVPTQKASAAISYYEEMLEAYTDHQPAVKTLMEKLLRDGWFERFLRVQCKLTSTLMDALGFDRIFEYVKLYIPSRYHSLFEEKRGELMEGFRSVHATLDDERIMEGAIEFVKSKLMAAPLVGLRHWLEMSTPAGNESNGDSATSERDRFKCEACGLTFGSQVELTGHVGRAHSSTRPSH
jgi:hypothetical protein